MQEKIAKNQYEVAVVPGDGIGPEMTQATIEVIKAAFGSEQKLNFTEHLAGANEYLRSGTALPEETLIACSKADAVLHGAAGLPDVNLPDGTEAGQDFSLKIRPALDLFANIRPIKLYDGIESSLRHFEPGAIDYVIVRENTEGLYAARGGGNKVRNDTVTDTMVMTRLGVERIVKTAAEQAMRRNGAPRDGKKRVTIVDKANVLRSFAFFREVAEGVLANYPEIEVDYALVDAMTVHMIERPDTFDVVVCENIIGDILSDLGAATVGGMGMSPSAEIGTWHGYFQASHGSAPTIAGKDIANPIGTILSGAFMLEWLAREHQDATLQPYADNIINAVNRVLADGRGRTRDIKGSATTSSATKAVCDALA